MIELRNISKVYKTKKGYTTNALKDINLILPQKGLIFIAGKSGCGKSTLLNILGGIEKPTSGSIFIGDKNLNELKPSEMDYYRGNLIGFIFQEYNLIGHLSVKENLKIANDINGRIISEQEIADVLKEVRLHNFANHLPEEMSGGQQQRIAIARAILKDSKIILADEPTGNLDSATGKDIFDLLKEISSSKLVIVVSHDRESAQKYGDGIIELKDGVMISNSLNECNKENIIINKKKTKLSHKNLAKFSFHNLRKKPATLIIAILLCIVAIGCGIYSQALADFKFYKNFTDTIEKNKINLYSAKKSYGKYYDFSDEIFSVNDINYITSMNINNMIYTCCNGNIIINSRADIDNMGMTMIEGSRELDDESIYVSDLFIHEKLSFMTYYRYQDGNFIRISAISDFIGDIYASKSIDSKQYTVAGIVVTGFADVERFDGVPKTKEEDLNNFYGVFQIFCTENYLRKHTEFSMYESIFNIEKSEISYENNTISQNYKFCEFVEDGSINSSIMIYQNGTMWLHDTYQSGIRLEENECIIPLSLYNSLFSASYKANDFVDVMDFSGNPKEMLELGQTINITVTGENKHQTLQNMKVVGIVFSPGLMGEDININDIYITRSHLNNFLSYFDIKMNSILGVIRDYKEYELFIKNSENLIINAAYADELYKYEDSIGYYKNTFLLISMIIILIAIFLLYYYINNAIVTEKKSIGILRSLGASQKDIIRIYMIQGVVISSIISLVLISAIIPLTYYANIWMAKNIMPGAILISLSPLMIIESLFASYISMLLAVLIPTIKLSKKKPIDVIRKI